MVFNRTKVREPCFIVSGEGSLSLNHVEAEKLIHLHEDPKQVIASLRKGRGLSLYPRSRFLTPNCMQAMLFLSFGLNSLLLMTITENSYISEDAPAKGYVRQNVIFGHLHIAKTAGSEINGALSNHFERICGNKGYSYDAFQTNVRFHANPAGDISYDAHDLVSNQFEGQNRGKVPKSVMDEIGFEDCDYISYEGPWQFWLNFSMWDMELHIPCRDPIEHLMSQCNFFKRQFNCRALNLETETAKCLMHRSRFSFKLARRQSIALKCFDPMPPESYLDYISTKLERKRIESDYVHRDTNHIRNREMECIWNDATIANRVRDILMENYDYYNFCEQCLGSDHDLLAS
jgi:hypothetical protein